MKRIAPLIVAALAGVGLSGCPFEISERCTVTNPHDGLVVEADRDAITWIGDTGSARVVLSEDGGFNGGPIIVIIPDAIVECERCLCQPIEAPPPPG